MNYTVIGTSLGVHAVRRYHAEIDAHLEGFVCSSKNNKYVE